MSTYSQLYDDKPERFALETRHKFACCGCGLVHAFVLLPDPDDAKNVFLTVRQLPRSTAARRREMRKAGKGIYAKKQ